MSKKNNQHTRARTHEFSKQREREAAQKKADKAAKKQRSEQQEAGTVVASGSGTKTSGITLSPKPKPGFSMPGVSGKKFKRKGIRIRKNASVRGIRITDAASKQKVKEILAAEEAMREMMVDDTEMAEKKKVKAGGVKKVKKTKKPSKKATTKKADSGMAVD